MTSAIDSSIIIETYPVAGQDNDSQGFRDNFAATKANFSTAAAEITKLQTNSVLVASLSANTPVVNDMLGSTITNGLYSQFNAVCFINDPVSGTYDININNGSVQKVVLSNNAVLRFTNWPDTGIGSTVRVIVYNNTGSKTVNFSSENSGVIKSATGLTLADTVGAGKYNIYEAISIDSGSIVFLRKLGEF